uniref:Uncharacterized protein n=1 Tax=Amphimedon queenslandica TaxID=400682 RepID=A0A1X7T823_AMPQE
GAAIRLLTVHFNCVSQFYPSYFCWTLFNN